jgi:hypothetical protein
MHSYFGTLCCLLLRPAHSDIFAAFDARKAALTCRSSVPLACGSARLGSQHGAQGLPCRRYAAPRRWWRISPHAATTSSPVSTPLRVNAGM